ncbi:uncharacterized protein [Nothobranchius furzeri]|uniref:LOC107378185-like protein n=1 Tax=Nothobranchius furzeri TaxID=105023 RepID=A0A1A7ZUC8_NOTFU|nr:putative LOC107378185-like protein [Nothobranchius furzeri]
MDYVTQEDVSPQSDLTSLPLSKRLRTDCSVTEDVSGNSTFNTSDARTSQECRLSPRNLQKTDGLTFTAECGHYDHNYCDKIQGSTLTSVTDITSQSSNTHTESKIGCYVCAERDGKPSEAKTDTLSLCLRDDTDGSLPCTRMNTPSPPDCNHLRLYSLPDLNEHGAQTDISQLMEDTFCSNQPDYSSKDAVVDPGLCQTGSQPTEAVKTSKDREEVDFSVPLSKAGCEILISFRDFENPNPLYSNPDETSGEIKKQESVPQTCEREFVSVWDVNTKGQANENSMNNTLICSAAESAERSVPTDARVMDTSVQIENFEINKCMEADQLSEMPVASEISQEPAEGDNDAFGVIDPVICSEIDKEVEGRLCISDSTEGTELSALGQICSVEITLPLCCSASTSQVLSADQNKEFNHQERTMQDENKFICLGYTQACSVTNIDTQDNRANCQSSLSSSSKKPPPAKVGGTEGSHDLVHQELKEQSWSRCCAASPNYIKMQEVEFSEKERDKVDMTAVINGRKEAAHIFKEKENNKEGTSQQQNQQDEDDGLMEEETSKQNSKLNCTDVTEELASLSNNPHCPDINGMDGTTKGTEQRGVIKFGTEIKTCGCETSEIKGTAREESPDGSVSEWLEGAKLPFLHADHSEQRLSGFSPYQYRSDLSMPITFPPECDAVVPCQPNLSHSENAQSTSTALTSSDRFPPSAFTLSSHVLRGFDTFEKIKLSPDDGDDDDAGLGSMPVLTSSPKEKAPEQQLHHHMQTAELDVHNKMAVEKDGGECHVGNMANGFVSSDSACNDGPNFHPAADVNVLTWPEQQPDCGSACDSSELTHEESNSHSECSAVTPEYDSDPNNSLQFEMKEQFDRVLKELRLFFDISRNDFASDCRPCSPEQYDAPKPLERNTSKGTEGFSQPGGLHRDDASPDKAVEDHSLEMCGVDPVASFLNASSDGEQEVPLNRKVCQHKSTKEKHAVPQEVEQNKKMWSPSFSHLPVLEQLSQTQLRRLEPLKTCTRPIRVGLSKRAKTKHLHRSHPYK